MTPNFAFSLTPDRLRLMQRADAGWLLVGEIALPEEHLRTAMSELRARGEALNGGPFSTKLLIPNDQIRYLTLGDSDAGDADMRAALDGATPYQVSDLIYDHSKGGGRTYVAAVARETLAEAEAFAREHQLNPVSFAAAPEPFTFVGEAVFGPTSDAPGGVLRDPDPVRVVGVARLPQPAPKPAPKRAARMPAPELVEAAPAAPALSFQRSKTLAPPPPELAGLEPPPVPEAPPARATPPAPETPASKPRPQRAPDKPAPAARAPRPVAPAGPLRPADVTPALTDRAVDFQTRLRARIAEQGLDKRLPRSAVPRPAFMDDPPPPPTRPPRRSWREALRAAKGQPLSDDPPDTDVPPVAKPAAAAPTVAFTPPAEAAAPATDGGDGTDPRAEPRIAFGAQAPKEVSPPAQPQKPRKPRAKKPKAEAAQSAPAAPPPWTERLSDTGAPPPVPPAAPPLRATNAPPAELTFELADKLPEPKSGRPWLLGGVLTVLLLGGLGALGSLATGGSDGLARLLGREAPVETVARADPADTALPEVSVPVAIPSAGTEDQTAETPVTAEDSASVAEPAPPLDPIDELAAAVANSVREAPADTEILPDPFELASDTLAAADPPAVSRQNFAPAVPQIDVPAGLTLAPGTTDTVSAPSGPESGPTLSAPAAVSPDATDRGSAVSDGTRQTAQLPQAAAPVIGDPAAQPIAPAAQSQPTGLGALAAGPAALSAPGALAAPGGLADRARPEVDTADPAPPEPEVAEVLEAPPILPAEPLGRVLSPAEAQRIYAATGVWQRAPRLPVTPRAETASQLASGATDTLDSVTRAATPGLDVVASFDSPLPTQVNPPPPGTVFERDDRGFVIATADGAATPDGILVFAGSPPLAPPIRPGTEPPPFNPASLAASAAEVTDTGAAILVSGRFQSVVPVRPGTEAPDTPEQIAEAPAAEEPAEETVAEAPPAEAASEGDELGTFMAALSDALAEEAGSVEAAPDPARPDGAAAEDSAATAVITLLDTLPQIPPSRPAGLAPSAPAAPEAAPQDGPAAFGTLAALPATPPTRPGSVVAAVTESVPVPEAGNRLTVLPARPPSRPASVARAAATLPSPEGTDPAQTAAPAEPAAPATPAEAPLPGTVARLQDLPVEPVLRPAGISSRASTILAAARIGAPLVNPPTRPATLVAAAAPAAPATTPEPATAAAPAPAPDAPSAAPPSDVPVLDTLPERPPSRPAGLAGDSESPEAEAEESPLLFLDRASVRPQPRPGSTNEDLASSTLAALTQTQPAPSATPGAVTLEALLRPAARPTAPPAAATAPDAGDLAAGVRPQARPGDEAAGQDAAAQAQTEIAAALAAAAITLEQSVPPSATATAQAVAISPRPDQRPRNMAAIVQRARAETARLAARQQSQQPAPAPRSVQPSGTTATSVAAAATQDGAINLGRMNLIGVAGSDSDRRALVRLANGRMQRVAVGDRLDGGQVQSIGDDFLTYTRGGRAVRLDMPG